MNEELVEAIAYGHDIGHAPFGHAGERQIDLFLKGVEPFTRRIRERMGNQKQRPEDISGDFKHNYQSIRILTFLEDYHPEYEDDGFDLTVPCLEGILKHTSMESLPHVSPRRKVCNYPGMREGLFAKLDLDAAHSITIEGQIVSVADEIAQVTHDINDALRIGALSIERLCSVEGLQSILDADRMRYPASIESCRNKTQKKHAQIMSALLNYFITVTIQQFERAISDYVTSRPLEASPVKLTGWLLPSNKPQDAVFNRLKRLKKDIVLNNFLVNRMDSKGEYIIRNLFEAYLNNPRQLPDGVLDHYCRVKKIELDKPRGETTFSDWLKATTKWYEIKDPLTPTDFSEIIGFLQRETDGREFRLLHPDLIVKLLPYFAVDQDFLRAIADHIASMTDLYAQEEFHRLYS
jgi:dGTPase